MTDTPDTLRDHLAGYWDWVQTVSWGVFTPESEGYVARWEFRFDDEDSGTALHFRNDVLQRQESFTLCDPCAECPCWTICLANGPVPEARISPDLSSLSLRYNSDHVEYYSRGSVLSTDPASVGQVKAAFDRP